MQAPLERLDSAWTGVACSAANLSTWQGVTCTNGRVTALDLTALRLAGDSRAERLFSPSPKPLLQLVVYVLRFTEAHKDMETLKAIIRVGLTSAGTLSESLSGMAGLTSVNLAKNNFTGTLPAGWSSMAALTSLELGENNLTGGDALPAELARRTCWPLLCLM